MHTILSCIHEYNSAATHHITHVTINISVCTHNYFSFLSYLSDRFNMHYNIDLSFAFVNHCF